MSHMVGEHQLNGFFYGNLRVPKVKALWFFWFIIHLGKLIIRGTLIHLLRIFPLEEYIYSEYHGAGRLDDAILPPRATPQFYSCQVSMLRHQRHQLQAVHCWLILLTHHLPIRQYILPCLLSTSLINGHHSLLLSWYLSQTESESFLFSSILLIISQALSLKPSYHLPQTKGLLPWQIIFTCVCQYCDPTSIDIYNTVSSVFIITLSLLKDHKSDSTKC